MKLTFDGGETAPGTTLKILQSVKTTVKISVSYILYTVKCSMEFGRSNLTMTTL